MKNLPSISLKGVFLSLLALSAATAYGQVPSELESVTVLTSRNDLNVCGFARDKADTLGSASLRIVYRLTYKAEPAKNPRESTWILLVGGQHTRCYSPAYERADSMTTELTKEHGKLIFRPQTPLEPTGEVYRDRTANTFQVIQRMPFEKNHVIAYREPAEPQQWQVLSQTDTVGGYLCYKALAEFGGRNWTAWYAPEIPVDAGPWKLHGLPGLILRATDDTGSYAFDLSGLEQLTLPVLRYGLPYKEQTKSKWLRTEAGFHFAPAFYFRHGGKHVFFEKGSTVELGKNWSVVYNPIERE